MYAVTIGTIGWRYISDPAMLATTEVLYTGDWVYGPGNVSYMVWDNSLNNVRPMTQAEIDAIPAQQTAAFRTNAANNAQVTMMQDAMFTRALCLTAMDEFNLHANILTQVFAAVAAATSLTDLKTRFAAISPQPPPPRTKQQLYNAIVGHIQDGSADGTQ